MSIAVDDTREIRRPDRAENDIDTEVCIPGRMGLSQLCIIFRLICLDLSPHFGAGQDLFFFFCPFLRNQKSVRFTEITRRFSVFLDLFLFF